MLPQQFTLMRMSARAYAIDLLQPRSPSAVPATGSDLISIRTDDGWSLALHRFKPREITRRHPVLMVHGLGANRLHFDLDERHSLARAAARRGFDVYVLELRGAGLSGPPVGASRLQFQWGFDDYAQRDLPTAVSAVLERTGAPSLHGVGHSMGGLLFYSVATGTRRELRSIASVGAPLIGQLNLGGRERRLLQLAASFSPATTFTPQGDGRVPLRRLLGTAGRFVPLARLADGILLNASNCEPAVLLKMARDAIDDIPVRLVTEITQHMSGSSSSTLGPYVFESQLGKINAPVLALSGAADRVAPPASVAAAVSRLASPDVRYRELGVRHGDRADYGHLDLLVGRSAPDEVYPLLLDFLEEVD
jgi:pimeloyl-ACP methyl ester carboxylesterase